MHYLVEEISRLPKPRPFLQMLGAIDESTAEIVGLARELLGSEGFSARSVSYREVFDYYRAADIFALCSLREGFGRVYLEALMHGLPVIAHRNAVTEYVLGGLAHLGDLNIQGELAGMLARCLMSCRDQDQMDKQWTYVCNRFGWKALAASYVEMFSAVSLADRV
jgi:glycosyltransferase involved in cell wall biosynthesis